MANKLAIATGNFTTAGTWVSGNTGTNAVLISTSTSTTALTTGNLDSATFVPAAQASQYLAIRVGTRAAGSPSNTMTIKLRNSTGATDVWTFIINVSDIPACANTTDDNAGWLVFKAAAAHTPNGTDSYVVRATLSATTTAVALCTNGTANNWQRQVFQTATGAPGVGDDMLIAGIWDTTNTAVKTDVAVTMDSTAATDYGSNTTTYRTAALNVCKGGTLTNGTTASTVYILQLSGWLVVYANGTVSIGTSGTNVPRSSTATWQFDSSADNSMGMFVRSAGIFNGYGQSPLSGVTATWAYLTTTVAAAATTFATSRQLSVANGGEFAIAGTTRAGTQFEKLAANGDAGASSIASTAGCANGHEGTTAPMQAEIISLSRNVLMKSVSSTSMGNVVFLPGSVVNCSWMSFQAVSSTTVFLEFYGNNAAIDHCVLRDTEGGVLFSDGSNTMTGLTVNEFVTYSVGGNSSEYGLDFGSTLSGASIQNVVAISAPGCGGMRIAPPLAAYTLFSDVHASGWTATGLAGLSVTLGDHRGSVYDNIRIHSGSGFGFQSSGSIQNATFSNFYCWRAGTVGTGLYSGSSNITFDTGAIFGNIANGNNGEPSLAGPHSNLKFKNVTIAGDSGFSSTNGVTIGNTTAFDSYVEAIFENCLLGPASGIYATPTTATIATTGVSQNYRLVFRDCTITGTNSLPAGGIGSFHSIDSGSAAGSKTVTGSVGTVAYETGTVDVTPSIKLTPTSATLKLDTAGGVPGEGFQVPVDSGGTPTVSIKIQKDGSYNGNAPRLVLKANPALGVDADTVLGTFSGGSGSWQTVSGACPAASVNGVYEVVVDCDGTAGNVFVDTLTVTGGSTAGPGGMKFWSYGLPAAMVSNVSGGAGPMGERSYVFGL